MAPKIAYQCKAWATVTKSTLLLATPVFSARPFLYSMLFLALASFNCSMLLSMAMTWSHKTSFQPWQCIRRGKTRNCKDMLAVEIARNDMDLVISIGICAAFGI